MSVVETVGQSHYAGVRNSIYVGGAIQVDAPYRPIRLRSPFAADDSAIYRAIDTVRISKVIFSLGRSAFRALA